MVDQNNTKSPEAEPSRSYRSGRRGTFVIALLVVALLGGVAGNMLSTAFGQGFGMHHISWHGGGVMGELRLDETDLAEWVRRRYRRGWKSLTVMHGIEQVGGIVRDTTPRPLWWAASGA